MSDAAALSALPTEGGDDVHVTGDGNFAVTIGESELTFRSRSFSAGWGGFTYTFANPGAGDGDCVRRPAADRAVRIRWGQAPQEP